MLEGKGSFKNMRRQKPVVFCVSVSDLSAHSVCVCVVHTQYNMDTVHVPPGVHPGTGKTECGQS